MKKNSKLTAPSNPSLRSTQLTSKQTPITKKGQVYVDTRSRAKTPQLDKNHNLAMQIRDNSLTAGSFQSYE